MELLKEGKYWTACYYKKIGMYVARIGWASPQGTQNCVYSIPGDVFEALGAFDDDNDNEKIIRDYGSLLRRFEDGEGVEQDCEKAVHWYTKAAEQGNDCAQKNLAVCYYEGTGVEQSYEKAVYWFTKSAEQGYEMAQENLRMLQQK